VTAFAYLSAYAARCAGVVNKGPRLHIVLHMRPHGKASEYGAAFVYHNAYAGLNVKAANHGAAFAHLVAYAGF
jgi:hypothetical protein